jgi:MFS family permease
VALMGIWTQNTAAQLVILSLTSSAFLIGAINIVSAVPMLLLMSVGGVMADRFDRRRIIMITQCSIASISAIWAILIFTDRIAYWHVLVLAAIAGTIVSFDLPSGQAFLAQLVRREDMPEAIALNSASVNATRMIGPAMAGVLIGILGTAVAFLSHTLALVIFVVVIGSLRKLLPPPTRSSGGPTGIIALREGFALIRKSDELFGLVLTTALFSFLAVPALLVLMPLFVTDVLGGSNGWVPAMTSIFGMGSLIAAITIFRASRSEVAAGRRLRLTSAGLCAGLLCLACSPNPWFAIPGVLISGCSFEMGLIQVQTRLQQLAPDHMRGRVLSVNGLAFNGVMPFSTLSISGASMVFGLPIVIGGSALALAGGAFLIWQRYTWKAFTLAEVAV